MKKFLLLLVALLALFLPAQATPIDIGASSIIGFNSANIGSDVALSNVSVTLASPSVTCPSCLPQSVVGLSGGKITLAGVVYDIAAVASRSAFTLTTNYAASTGTVSGTLHKFAVLRIYVTAAFTPFGESFVVQSGTQGSTAWYRRYAVSVINDGAQNVAHLPQINDLPATTDSSNPTAAYVSGLYTQAGGLIQSYPRCVSAWQLSHLTSPTSWAQICTFNSPPNPPPPQPINFLTEAQINARFPSCLMNNLDFFAATGNVKSCLTLSSEFSISGGILSLAASGYNRIQEEGSNLPQRQTLNFIGTSFTAADDTTRTNITADADLNALASNATNGFWARTGAGTGAARTLQQPAAGFTITNPAGTAGDPTFTLANDLAAVEGLATTGGAYRIGSDSWVTRTLTGTTNRISITNGDGVAGNPTFDIGTDVVTLTGTQTLTNKTLTSPRIGTSVLDVNGNSLFGLTATGSAVNFIQASNSATGVEPTLAAAGSDTNISLKLLGKGTSPVLAGPRLDVTETNSPALRLIRTAATARNAQLIIDNADNLLLQHTAVANFFSAPFSTRVITFDQIPVLPAANPTTANQASRKQYVDDRQVSFSVSFTIVDPSTANLNVRDFGSLIIPAGGQYTITKCKVMFREGSHTTGGSLTFKVDQAFIGDKCSLTLDNTNNTIATIYTDDVGDFTVNENAIMSMYISARSGTITEKSVSVVIEGFRKVF